MRNRSLVALQVLAATAGLPAQASVTATQEPTRIQLLHAPLEGGPNPKPTPKKGKPTKAEKKAAKRARTRGVGVLGEAQGEKHGN